MTQRWPLTPEAKANMKKLLADIKKIDGQIGGWSSKSEARQTGLSLYIKFTNKVDVVATTMPFMNLLQNAPGMLVDGLERLLELAGPDDVVETERGKPHAERCGAQACPCYVEAQRKTIETYEEGIAMQDHGSDRYDEIELSWPRGMDQPPTPTWLTADWMPCQDCRANAFLKWLPEEGRWHVTIAHDETCPNPDAK